MQRDSFIVGVIIGALAPIVAYLATTYTALQQQFFADKPIALYVLAAVVNLVIVRFAFKAGKSSFAKGIVLVTFLAMFGFFIFNKIKI